MTRRGRLPHFSPTDEEGLLRALGDARRKAILYGEAAGYNSSRYRKTDAFRNALDSLAEELTGDPKHFWTNR
jgi:hypothetical protein